MRSGEVRSHIPLRGSPGISPGSLEGLSTRSGTKSEGEHIGVPRGVSTNLLGYPFGKVRVCAVVVGRLFSGGFFLTRGAVAETNDGVRSENRAPVGRL